MDTNSSFRALPVPPDIALAKTGLQQTYQRLGLGESLKQNPKTYVVVTASIMLKASEPGSGRKHFLIGVAGASSNSLEIK